MRVTVVLRHQHIGNQFYFAWLTQARKKLRQDGVRAALEDRGIQVVDAKDLITPAFITR